MNRPHPLDQLVKNDSIFFLEAMIPFVDYAYKKPLVLLIKFHEIKALMQCFDNPSYIAECGFDCHPDSSEEMMDSLCRFLPGDFAGNLKNMQQMMKMMRVMQAMNEAEGSDKNQNQGSGKGFNFEDLARNFGSMPFNSMPFNPSSFDSTPSHDEPSSQSYSQTAAPDKNLYDSVMSILDE